MANVDVENAFHTENCSVYQYLNQSGLGLYIPLYQREYSWDDDNINQLLEDVAKGVTRIIEGCNEIRFLGTIITVKESNKNNLHPVEVQSVPASVENIIDGQQRLSTIAIFACLLCRHLDLTLKRVKANNYIYDNVVDICDSWKSTLLDIISVEIKDRLNHIRQPKIIRGSIDFWTKTKPIEEAYRSPVARFLADSIEAIINPDTKNYPTADKSIHGTQLSKTIKMIDKWLKNITTAHISGNDDFPSAWEIMSRINDVDLVFYDRKKQNGFDIEGIINKKDFSSNKTDSYILCEIIQLAAVCHYLLDRCCFTLIQPSNEDWAFDMFQSLNATGTPLTAIETFKPLIVNDTNEHGGYKDSENEKSMSKVENLFSEASSAQQKSKLTNDFLTSFYVAYNGISLSSHFSHQRRALIESYEARETHERKIEFVKFLGQYADFYSNIWIKKPYKGTLETLKMFDDGELATLLIAFLNESKHKMAIPVLATFYRDIYANKDYAPQKFIEATKAVAAFYILWRSTNSNAGLDNVYRDYFKAEGRVWKYETGVSIEDLKTHFRQALILKGIDGDKESWKKIATQKLTYDEVSTLCRLILMISFHDTIPDDSDTNYGLMKASRTGVSPYMTLEKWNSDDLRTIEHIAPQKNGADWDNQIYDIEKPLVHTLGNLTLLPQDINSSVGNKGWKEKYLYYLCISTTESSVLTDIYGKAKSLEVELNPDTVKLMQNCSYNAHMTPLIKAYEQNIEWNSVLIQKRTERILDIAWEFIYKWLYV